jgi:hypothetical protein
MWPFPTEADRRLIRQHRQDVKRREEKQALAKAMTEAEREIWAEKLEDWLGRETRRIDELEERVTRLFQFLFPDQPDSPSPATGEATTDPVWDATAPESTVPTTHLSSPSVLATMSDGSVERPYRFVAPSDASK